MVEKINSMLVQPALFSASFIQTDGTDSEDKITEKPEKLSRNSVLEPFSSEDDANPANSPDKIGILQKKFVCCPFHSLLFLFFLYMTYFTIL